MNTLLKNTCRILLFMFVVSCSSDDGLQMEPAELVEVEFGADTFYSEVTQDNDITILFDKPAFVAGTITVKVISDAPLFFNTLPAPVNNEISVPVTKGAESAKFKFNPRDDWYIDGHKQIIFELKAASEGFNIGIKNNLLVDLFDDELWWKPRAYETISGENRTKKTYEYMQDGKLAKVLLETETSQGSNSIIYTYLYDAHNKLHRIENSGGGMEYFTWENGKIVQSEYIKDGVGILRKKIYYYNDEGKINQVNIMERSSNDPYGLVSIESYEYLGDNLKKKVVMQPENLLNWILVSTHTYETYLEKDNLFQMNEILPTNISQKHLPLKLRVEENEANVLITYAYEYNSIGLPVNRTAEGEVTTYSYY